MCVATGFKHFIRKNSDVRDRSRAGMTARGTMEVRFFQEESEDSIDCAGLAEEKKVKQAKKVLAKKRRR